MRRLLLIMTLVAGCATDDDTTITETQELKGYGGCRATGPFSTFEGYWYDQSMTRCCYDTTRGDQTQTYCVSCDRGVTCASTYPPLVP